jgi:hypothetical protein
MTEPTNPPDDAVTSITRLIGQIGAAIDRINKLAANPDPRSRQIGAEIEGARLHGLSALLENLVYSQYAGDTKQRLQELRGDFQALSAAVRDFTDGHQSRL